MLLFVAASLLFCIACLSVALYSSHSTLRRLSLLHFRDMVLTRSQYTRMVTDLSDQVRSLTESLCRSEGKVYIPPQGAIDEFQFEPSVSAFKFRPNPPVIRIVATDKEK